MITSASRWPPGIPSNWIEAGSRTMRRSPKAETVYACLRISANCLETPQPLPCAHPITGASDVHDLIARAFGWRSRPTPLAGSRLTMGTPRMLSNCAGERARYECSCRASQCPELMIMGMPDREARGRANLAVRTAAGFGALVVAVCAALFGPAWTFDYWQAWVYLVASFGSAALITLYLW